MSKAKDISEIITDANFGGTLDVTGAITGASTTLTGDITASSFNSGQLGGRRNLVINGAMQVAQRGTSETGISTSGYYTVDRMRISSANTAGRFTMTQETISDLPGFANAVKLDCTTADTSIASNELLTIATRLEGQDLQQLKKGTADAEKITVSFYVKGNASATYVLELYDADNTRQVSKSFAVTTSWNRVSLTFDGDTTGAFGDDNGLSLLLQIWLHAGSDYTSGTLSTSWSSATAANRAVGISSFFDSTDRTFSITGVQMEVGSVATPFEHLSFGETLALCQRYFYRWKTDGEAYSNLCIGGCTNTSTARGIAQFPQVMRSNASVSSSGTFRIVSMGGGGVRTGITITINRGHTLQPYMDFSSSGGSNLTAGNPAEMGANNDNASIIDFNAEL